MCNKIVKINVCIETSTKSGHYVNANENAKLVNDNAKFVSIAKGRTGLRVAVLGRP